jgi:hypothetical protein
MATKKAIIVPAVFDEIRLGTIDGEGIGGSKVEIFEKQDRIENFLGVFGRVSMYQYQVYISR